MKVDYNVVYSKTEQPDAVPEWSIWAKEIDYYYAYYAMIHLTDKFSMVEIHRYVTTSDGSRTFTYVMPTRGQQQAKENCLLGGDNALPLHSSIADVITTEGEASAYAAGIELGIMRAASFLQTAACNTESDSEVLEEYADELMVHAPSYNVRWRTIQSLNLDLRVKERNAKQIKAMSIEAKDELHTWLGAEPKLGILDLPKVRELFKALDNL